MQKNVILLICHILKDISSKIPFAHTVICVQSLISDIDATKSLQMSPIIKKITNSLHGYHQMAT